MPGSTLLSRWLLPAAIIALAAPAAGAMAAQADGAQIYRTACMACHGPNGKGMPPEDAGTAAPVPDFSDCRISTSERLDDWVATISNGGNARGFRTVMPAFGDALDNDEIRAVAAHLRTFCVKPRWPDGDLNYPRPLSTEKAFPENELVLSGAMPTSDVDTGELRIVYERRVAAHGQVEAIVPLTARLIAGDWYRGIGDIAFGYKQVVAASRRSGTIVSGSGGLTVPTGNELHGLGTRLMVLEMSALVGQRLAHHSFAHAQTGLDLPLNIASTPDEVFWRAAFGTTLNAGKPQRAWTPIIEVTGHRELEYRDPVRWDLVPQLQVTLSQRQHVSLNAGVRLPVGGPSRPAAAIVSLTWDWFDGGLLTGW